MTIVNNEAEKPVSQRKFRLATCAVCRDAMQCVIHASHTDSSDLEADDHYTTWRILECTKCHYIFVELACVDTSAQVRPIIGPDGEQEYVFIEETSYFPPLPKEEMPDWFKKYVMSSLDHPDTSRLRRALVELYRAVDKGEIYLAEICLKRCFEIVSGMLDVSDTLPFQRKLDAIFEKGAINIESRQKLNLFVHIVCDLEPANRDLSEFELASVVHILEDCIFVSLIKSDERTMIAAHIDIDKARVQYSHYTNRAYTAYIARSVVHLPASTKISSPPA